MQGNKNYFIVAIMLLIVLYFPLKINQQMIDKSHTVSKQYNEMMASATSDAAKQLVYAVDDYSNDIQSEGKRTDYRNINLNLDKALDRFYNTIYLNLNIEDNYAYQQSIKYKMPIKIATGYEGYHISYFNNNGDGELWSELKPYSMVDETNNLVIFFTLGEEVTVADKNDNTEITGTYKDFKNKYPNSCFKDKETFEEIRSQVINSMIKEDLEYYTYYSNRIAQTNHWNIRFNVPYWGNRAISGISFIAFYQGEAFIGADEKYNSYGYAASQIVVEKDVYGYEINGKKYYSTEKRGTNPIYFPNRYEAAMEGYSPDLEYYYNNR